MRRSLWLFSASVLTSVAWFAVFYALAYRQRSGRPDKGDTGMRRKDRDV